MPHRVEIQQIDDVTHDVKRFLVTKPDGYTFTPGQATDVAVDDPEWRDETRPFTFTSLNDDPQLEFTIKRYPQHEGVTDRLHKLQVGDGLLIDEPWGAITYKGPGYFIAGGAGITPFVAILRQLHRDGEAKGNTLFFSNKTKADIIYHDELEAILGGDANFILTREAKPPLMWGRIDQAFLKNHLQDFSKEFYVCGPPKMIEDITSTLEDMGARADNLVLEE